MRITLGIDVNTPSQSTIGLLADLDFSSPEVDLVHVIEQLGVADLAMPAASTTSGDVIARYLEMQRTQAQQLLAAAQAQAKERGLPAKSHILVGFSSNKLQTFIEETKADLLAVGSSDKSAMQRVFLGSVARKAVIHAGCSVLIARASAASSSGVSSSSVASSHVNNRSTKRPLTAVLATDHSDYANRCFALLPRFLPRGIGRLIVTTIYPAQLVEAMRAIIPHFKANTEEWVQSELERSNQKLIATLDPLGCRCESRVIASEGVNDSIEKVVTEERADLLIVGAQGHSFVQRAMIGSVSLHQAMHQSKSVLVLRA